MKAIETGVARVKYSRDELRHRAETIIKRARGETKLLMDQGYIRSPPE
jgi:malate dehydrogenase (oxaloacetate-decarboxylating)